MFLYQSWYVAHKIRACRHIFLMHNTIKYEFKLCNIVFVTVLLFFQEFIDGEIKYIVIWPKYLVLIKL